MKKRYLFFFINIVTYGMESPHEAQKSIKELLNRILENQTKQHEEIRALSQRLLLADQSSKVQTLEMRKSFELGLANMQTQLQQLERDQQIQTRTMQNLETDYKLLKDALAKKRQFESESLKKLREEIHALREDQQLLKAEVQVARAEHHSLLESQNNIIASLAANCAFLDFVCQNCHFLHQQTGQLIALSEKMNGELSQLKTSIALPPEIVYELGQDCPPPSSQTRTVAPHDLVLDYSAGGATHSI